MNEEVLFREMKVKEIEEMESESGKDNFVRVKLCTRTLGVKVAIEVPPPLILNRTRLVFHQFSNSTIQVLAIEGLLLILIFLANQDVTLVELLKERLMLGESIQKWKLS